MGVPIAEVEGVVAIEADQGRARHNPGFGFGKLPSRDVEGKMVVGRRRVGRGRKDQRGLAGLQRDLIGLRGKQGQAKQIVVKAPLRGQAMGCQAQLVNEHHFLRGWLQMRAPRFRLPIGQPASR